MSKELEELGRGILEFEKELEYDCNNEWLKRVIAGMKKCYQRLESIDNANPSEALECLQSIEADLIGLPKHVTEYDDIFDDYLDDIEDNIDTIKQALLKAQEPKKFLKWEDLDFKKVSKLDHKIIKAKLNEQLYELDIYRYDGDKRVEIRAVGKSYDYNLGEGYVVCIDDEFPENIQFFNDLHLEVVK